MRHLNAQILFGNTLKSLIQQVVHPSADLVGLVVSPCWPYGGVPNLGTPSHHPFIDGFFPYKPSIIGYPQPPYLNFHVGHQLPCWPNHAESRIGAR